ncbi:thioredoxin-like protein [Zalerion maritima]|uniref:Thioredoxin-like protein n=1 Tax=Zalerion maritima TaxID=339359 RepID=A0AAD5RJL7_9PEZI|nr:thioredoxin-like protein [Zalerion maritima]
MSAHQINSPSELDALLASTTYVIVDFYADWCPPCKMIAPMFQSLASSHSVDGKLAFAKVNVDSQQQLAMRYGITAMPTFLMLKNGEPVSNVRGANAPSIQAMVRTAEGELVKLGKQQDKMGKKKEEEQAEGTGEEKKKDSETVSGGYTMSKGTRSDWKMSLTR